MHEWLFEDFRDGWEVDYSLDSPIHIRRESTDTLIQIEQDDFFVSLWEPRAMS